MGLSTKQLKILAFGASQYDALICDGAVRSGKTSIMSIAFVLWMMANFDNQNFAFCGKTVGTVERNIIGPLLNVRYLTDNYDLQYSRSTRVLTVRRGRKQNRVYLFGGKDESSYMLIQGITLAGVLMDEVALMPKSFVDQALARCSVPGSKYWFNCNPASPAHWFRQEWILQPAKHNALHLHFLLDDNPGLSESIKERYCTMYSGVFYERYIMGRWVMAEGTIYSMYDPTDNVYTDQTAPVDMAWRSTRTIAIDYGTTNPTRYLDIYDDGEVIRVHREYNWDSRQQLRQKTDAEYADDLEAFTGGEPLTIIVDPSAASFIAELRSRGMYVLPANNDVMDGIRKTATLLQRRQIQVNDQCRTVLDEFGAYVWDDKAAARGEERPVKQFDHSMDALRYYINSLPDWRFEDVSAQQN
nr:MAG TPA: large terminase [Caudoviricetes sp.]